MPKFLKRDIVQESVLSPVPDLVMAWRRSWYFLQSRWNRTDTIVMTVNIGVFLLFVGNVGWQSNPVAYLAPSAALILLATRVQRDAVMRQALWFGAFVALTWPLGEWALVHTLGWWGGFLVTGPALLETPLYCLSICWLACFHCVYVGRRVLEWGAALPAAMAIAGLSALFVGAVGENLYVAAGLWYYHPSAWDWVSVPAFVPITYGIGYAISPLLRKMSLVYGALLLNAFTLAVSVTLGLLTGFFPR